MMVFASRRFSALESPLRFGWRGGIVVVAVLPPVVDGMMMEFRFVFDSASGEQVERRASMSRCFLSLTRSCLLDRVPASRSRVEDVRFVLGSFSTAWKGGAVLGRDNLLLAIAPIGRSGRLLLGGGEVWCADRGVLLRTSMGPSSPTPLYFRAVDAVPTTISGGEFEDPAEVMLSFPWLMGELSGEVSESFSISRFSIFDEVKASSAWIDFGTFDILEFRGGKSSFKAVMTVACAAVALGAVDTLLC